jgi:hypothetical protein
MLLLFLCLLLRVLQTTQMLAQNNLFSFIFTLFYKEIRIA